MPKACQKGPERSLSVYSMKTDFFCCRLFTTLGVNWCNFYWTGVSHRAMFLHQCLEKFPYGRMHEKVRYLIRGMRWIGRKVENAEQRGQTLLQAGGGTQILGSIFGGIGVGKFLLCPFSTASLTF